MNQDIFEGQWKQVRGKSREWWGKLTDNDVDKVGGKFTNLVGVIQEKYGYTREKAEDEVNRRFAEHDAPHKPTEVVTQ